MVKSKCMTAAVVAVLSSFTALSLPTRADDTEIYLNPSADIETQPLVMFSLDYRPNLTAPAKPHVESFFAAAGMGADVAELKAISGELTYFDTLILSLKFVLSEISGVKIGLMMSHQTGKYTGYQGGTPTPANKRDSGGGTVLYGFNSLDNPATIVDFKKKLIALKKLNPSSGSPDHKYQGAELFFEFFRYLTGGQVFDGQNGWVDFESGSSIDTATNMRCASSDNTINPACWDKTIQNPSNPPANNAASNPPAYISPLNGIDACTKIYTINFLFQVSQDETDSNAAIEAAKSAGGMNISPGTSSTFENVLKFLRDADLGDGTYGTAGTLAGKQNVTSYFLVDPTKINQKTKAYAQSGGTGVPLPLAEDPQELIDALRNIFQQILSTSTTFVAASVPVNVFNRAEAVDNVYLALFQAEYGPGWPGTIKKIRFKTATFADGSSQTILVDSLNNFTTATDTTPAFGADGRIRYDALTHWSDNAGNFMQLGDANSDGIVDTRDASNNPVNPPNVTTDRDGRHIKRGGSGQKIPGFTSGSPGLLNADTGARKLFYDSATNTLSPLNADATTATALYPSLGVADSALALPLLKWIRGIDVDDADGDTSTTDTRSWLMGDPLHSRPLPINYGTNTDYVSKRRPGIFIAIAANDGYLRFIENTLPGASTPATGNAEPASVQSGKELWAFMPKSAMPHQKLLRQYDGAAAAIPDSVNPNELASPDPAQTVDSSHVYTLDGAPSSLVIDLDRDGVIEQADGDRVYIYFGMRRGGRNYYGMNVTDPYSPQLMWVIEGGTTGFEELGRTFSQPKTGKVRDGATIKNAVFFTGGYSLNKDRKVMGTDDTVGNAIFVVDAASGALIWKASGSNTASAASASNFKHAGLVDSIPSNLTVVDTDGDSDRVLDRIVVGDTGGNVWRADISTGTGVNAWKLTKLASLGRHAGTSDKPNDRRFMNEPDFVQEKDSAGAYDAVIIGSGDREDPIDRGGVTQNWFYLIKDRNIGVGAGANSSLVHSGLTDVTDVCVANGQTGPCTTGSLALGWKMQLEEAVGEKNLAPALTFDGTVFFTSYLPPGTSEEGTCGPAEGNGLLYAIRLEDAAPAYNYDTADGSNAGGANTQGDRTDGLASGGIPSQVVFLPPGDILRPDGGIEDPGSTPSFRTFWRRRED